MHPFLDFVHADDKENTQRKWDDSRRLSNTWI
jgi:hypothetical protein